MSIRVSCSGCGRQYRCRDEQAGKRFRCRDCKAVIAIPTLDDGVGSEVEFPQLESEPHLNEGQQAKRRKSATSGEDTGLLAGNPWWGFLLLALFFIGAGIWIYVDLAALEADGGERRVHWVMALLYRSFGKWGAVALPFLMGIGFLGGGIFKLAKGR